MNSSSLSLGRLLCHPCHYFSLARRPVLLRGLLLLLLVLSFSSSSNNYFGLVEGFVIPQQHSSSPSSSSSSSSSLFTPFSSSTTSSSSSTTTSLMGIKGFRSWFESTFPNAMMAPLIPSQGVHDEFDHVLIDMNQILHVVLRKSRSDGHALTLLMKELDQICRMATPTQSLILAMDGPPAAAKVATQRRRRYSTVVRNQWKLNQIQKFSSRFTKAKKTHKIRRYKAEVKTLCITPGTEFMTQTEQALLYWSWQRLVQQKQLQYQKQYNQQQLSNNNKNRRNNNNRGGGITTTKPRSVLGNPSVKIYISPSTVPGEGEVKLLEWILQHPHKISGGTSIAILGGDSDLVLEGLIVPLQWTHNVFVLLPEGSKHYIAVSLWEMTRSLSNQLFPTTSSSLAVPSSTSTSKSQKQKQREKSKKNNNKQQLSYDVGQQQQSHLLKNYHVISQIRTDFVLLVIFNGNDYLPRLRGSSGFNRIFHTYMRLVRKWQTQYSSTTNLSTSSSSSIHNHQFLPGLVDPDRLEFRLEFCIAFFQQLARFAPHQLRYRSNEEEDEDDDDEMAVGDDEGEEEKEYQDEDDLDAEDYDDEEDGLDVDDDDDDDDDEDIARSERPSSLAQLHTMLDAGFLPQPMKWQVIRTYNKTITVGKDDSMVNKEQQSTTTNTNTFDSDDGKNPEVNPKDQKVVLVRLKLGVKGSDDYFQFETRKDQTLKLAKQKLASLALTEILEGYSADDGPVDGKDESVEAPLEKEGVITSNGYAWEAQHAVEANIEEYLAGLLWNLQTYQDGICSDYAYNYGKRQSPTAHEVVEYFQRAKAENRTISRRTLLSGNKGDDDDNNNDAEANSNLFSPPVSAGLSCLAALPNQVKDLVPEPYRWLPDATVEDFYAQCMDPNNNVFDLKEFERLCEAEIETIREQRPPERDPEKDSWSSGVNGGDDDGDDNNTSPPSPHGRRIIMGDHYWTVLGRSKDVLTHPFEPPLPFSDRLSKLRPDNRIRASRLIATSEPRPRSVWMEKVHDTTNDEAKNGDQPKRRKHAPLNEEVTHLDLGSLLDGGKSIMDVGYKIAYRKEIEEIRAAKNGQKGQKRSKMKILTLNVEVKEEGVNGGEGRGPPGKKHQEARVDLLTDIDDRMKRFQLEHPPKNAATSKDGQTAVAVLKQLRDAGLVGKMEYTYKFPSTSSYASFGPENYEFVTLTVERGKNKDLALFLPTGDLVYEQDRHVNNVSRQALKQHLASLALCDLTGPRRRWSELTFVELKDHLVQHSKSHRSNPRKK